MVKHTDLHPDRPGFEPPAPPPRLDSSEESFWEESFWEESFWEESFWEAMCKHAHINAIGDAKGNVQAMLNNC